MLILGTLVTPKRSENGPLAGKRRSPGSGAGRVTAEGYASKRSSPIAGRVPERLEVAMSPRLSVTTGAGRGCRGRPQHVTSDGLIAEPAHKRPMVAPPA